jgi:RNA polymerase sigma-70 factor (ECF subfamily)
LFQEITIQLCFPKFRGESKFSTWAYRVAEYGDYFVPKTKRSINTVEFEGRQHFLNDVEYDYEEEEQLKLMYKAVYQLNDIEKALILCTLKIRIEISETLGISR